MQALIGTLFTWLIIALGASLVFFCKTIHKTLLDGMLSFAAGVMIAASFWSLLIPSLEMGNKLFTYPWIVTFCGFLCGGLFLFVENRFFSHFLKKLEGAHTADYQRKKRCMMLLFSMMLHNIPEGLIVGVAFGSLAYPLEGGSFSAACMLALETGVQNFPEGSAVSISLRREGMSRKKSFFYSQLSGIVEPIAGLLGAFLVLYIRMLLPFLLSFAAGAMIFVSVQELIPESQKNSKNSWMTGFCLLGFAVMMLLDAMFS